MESDEAESIYSVLRYDSDFYLTSAAQDGSQWIAGAPTKTARVGRSEAIDSVLGGKGTSERARSRLYDA